MFRHEVQSLIRNAVRASDADAVLFVGSGTTGAVHKLHNGLKPCFSHHPPIVFVGPFEHHSNLLPWREMASRVIRIKETAQGILDLDDLECQLKACKAPAGTVKVGCFSAASNVTGIWTRDVPVTKLLHKYGALSFWDYAAAGKYEPLFYTVGENRVTRF
jgi:selenocysteine lyase/cysteine desulfurase